MDPQTIPADTVELKLKFDAWRQTRGSKSIRSELWQEAVKVAKVFGRCRVAKFLGLNAHELKKQQSNLRFV